MTYLLHLGAKQFPNIPPIGAFDFLHFPGIYVQVFKVAGLE